MVLAQRSCAASWGQRAGPLLRQGGRRRGRMAADASQQRGAVTLPDLRIHAATTVAELRSAAYLRAYTFYTYPEGRSEFSTRSHRRMKGDAEWEAVTAKVQGYDQDYRAMHVICFVASILQDEHSQLVQRALVELDPSAKLPPLQVGQPPRLVVGSLDVNQGAVLPAEELVGRLPQDDAGRCRAYLSNVCVTPAARRSGVASDLIAAAEGAARGAGVAHLYVHVVAGNEAGERLYQRLGFEVEAEEGEAAARALGRPRRRLLHKQL